MSKLVSILRIIRNFLFSRLNKEFLMFLFFVMLSSVFWLITTLNDTIEKELSIPVRIVNIPKNVVLTSSETDTLKVTVRDKGWILLNYMVGDTLHPISINYSTYAHNNGQGSVSQADLQRAVYQQLSASSKITTLSPTRLEFFFNYGISKRVPVMWQGNVNPEKLYFISDVRYQPDSISIYASRERLDSIACVYTEQLDHTDFHDSLHVSCRLQPIRGVKLVPDRVDITFYTDVLTETRMANIPILGINMPEGKALRTFPSKVAVRFVTGVKQFRKLRPQDFTVVVDYDEIIRHPSDKCNLHLRNTPEGISRATLEVKQVDYLIEEE